MKRLFVFRKHSVLVLKPEHLKYYTGWVITQLTNMHLNNTQKIKINAFEKYQINLKLNNNYY